jgi:hypothetical protein
MSVDAEKLKALIDHELEHLSDARVLKHIRGLLVESEIVYRAWDYGAPGEKYPCWTVLKHAASNTGIAYCEQGFGPRCPWGLVGLGEDEQQGSMGMDSGWFTSFLDAYFESLAAADLPIWRVFKESTWSATGSGEPITEEDSWTASWAKVEEYRKADSASRYHCHHSVAYRRESLRKL